MVPELSYRYSRLQLNLQLMLVVVIRFVYMCISISIGFEMLGRTLMTHTKVVGFGLRVSGLHQI